MTFSIIFTSFIPPLPQIKMGAFAMASLTAPMSFYPLLQAPTPPTHGPFLLFWFLHRFSFLTSSGHQRWTVVTGVTSYEDSRLCGASLWVLTHGSLSYRMEGPGLHRTLPSASFRQRRPQWLLLTTGTWGYYLGSTHRGPITMVIDHTQLAH